MSKKKNIQTKAKTTPLLQPEIKKTAGWKPYLVFTLFAFILYANTLNHFFVLDDGIVLTDNVFTQKGIKGIPNIFKYDTFVGSFLEIHSGKTADQMQEEMKMVAGGRYRPLSLVTFALEIQFFGKTNSYPNTDYEFLGNAFVSHLNNILLYLFTTCLLYLILCRLVPAPPSPPEGGDVERNSRSVRTSLTSPPSGGLGGAWAWAWFPFIVTLLFLAHPIHTEVVANIKGRDEIMTLLGALAALWFTIKYFDTNKSRNLWLSGLCLFLGLLSKENAITFLAVIPITIYYFVDKNIRKIFKSLVPLIVASATFLLIRGSVIGFTSTSAVTAELMNDPFLYATRSETLATIFYTLLMYVKLLFFPHPLTYDYYPHHIEITNWTNPMVILSLLFYLGITAYAIYGLKPPLTPPKGENCDRPSGTSPLSGRLGGVVSYSIWFYLLPLTIVSNLFFPIGVFMGERFIFISSIGFCIFVGWLIYNYLPKITKNVKSSTYLTSFVLIIILCLYSAKTIDRNKAWKDHFTLVTTDLKTSEKSAKGNFMVGYDLLKKAVSTNNTNERSEYCEEAARYFKRAIELHPTFADPIVELGDLYFDCYKDVANALHHYALVQQETAFNSAKSVLNQTVTLLYGNEISSTPEEIIQACDELIKKKPDFWEAYYIKGIVYGIRLNNAELSLMNFEKAESINTPKTIDFYNNTGYVLVLSRNYEKAVQYLLKAVELGSEDSSTYINLGIAYQQLGDVNKRNYYTTKGNEMKNTGNNQ